ncbi:MAG: response regulator transcription factor [Myxococcota bacterium]
MSELQSPQTRPLCVVVVCDDPLARRGLSCGLESVGAQILDQLTTRDDPWGGAALYGADAVVFDLGTEPERALRRVESILDAQIPTVVLAPVDGAPTRLALDLGARGVLSRALNPAQILSAVSAVARGNVVLDDDALRHMLQGGPGIGPPDDPAGSVSDSPLTQRELEVLELMAEGFSNKNIAEDLGISAHTAKFHVHSLLHKLDASSRTEAVVAAVRLGWLVL